MTQLAERKPNGSTELVLTSPQPDTMLTVIERAVMSPDFDVAKMQQLLDMRERYEANEARKAFVEALSAFKSRAIQVAKDKLNPQYNSKYVSLGNLVNTVTPFLSAHGLSCRWDIDQAAGIKVTCVLTHVQGHSESVSMVCPPDDSGKKNPIQQIKSAITYGKACTFESICGLASTDATFDDDGNSGGVAGLSDERYLELLTNIEGSNNMDELKNCYFAANNEAAAAKDTRSQKSFSDAKNKRYKEIANASR
jgi:hypothetical protein